MLGHSGVCVYVLVYRNGPTRIQGTLMDGNGRTRVMERGGTEFIWNISPIVPKAGREGDLKGSSHSQLGHLSARIFTSCPMCVEDTGML